MTALNSEIKITNKLRPCLINGQKALFHRWADTTDILLNQSTKGIVEYENGQVRCVLPFEIKFLPLNFNEYCFNEKVTNNETKS